MLKKLHTAAILSLILCASVIAAQFTATVELVPFAGPVAAGSPIGIFAQLENTSDRQGRFVTTFTATSNCDSTTYAITSTTSSLGAGRSVNIGYSWNIPAGACAGQYTVLAEVEVRNAVVASGSEVLMVTN